MHNGCLQDSHACTVPKQPVSGFAPHMLGSIMNSGMLPLIGKDALRVAAV
jgi:hypothetical protein